MFYAPVPPPSERARELGGKLAEAVRNFLQENPGVSALEIRQAFRLALTEIGIKSQAAPIALAIGLVVLGLASLLFLGRGLQIENPSMILGIVVLIAVIALGISFVRRNQ